MLEATAELSAISADERRWAELSAPTLCLIERLQAHAELGQLRGEEAVYREHAESLLLQDFFAPAED